MTLTETTLDNLLVGQKDRILGTLNVDNYALALSLLVLVQPLWVACGYSYKGREICERIDRELWGKAGSHNAQLRIKANELSKCFNQ